ncbi:MAG: ASCH domain-containing protein [Planctomycetes bacterium]|nr:ASCH domain-containing protein [Planctomycetota bacterium]
MKTISIRQPWAWAILHAGKDIENRTWVTTHRGPTLIHTGKTCDRAGCIYIQDVLGIPVPGKLPRGGIVGIVDIAGCTLQSDSKWFCGPCGFILENARELPFRPYKGRLRLFDVKTHEGYTREIKITPMPATSKSKGIKSLISAVLNAFQGLFYLYKYFNFLVRLFARRELT